MFSTCAVCPTQNQSNADDPRLPDSTVEGRVKPIVFDLFCGLGQSLQFKLLNCADSLVEQFVAGWTQNPNHVRATVFHFSPCPVSFEVGPMGYFQHPFFPTRLARFGQFGILAYQPCERPVFVRTPGIVNFLFFGIFFMKGLFLFTSHLRGAMFRAISAITCGLNNVKMLPTNATVSALLCNIGLLATPQPSKSAIAVIRTTKLVWPFCTKRSRTLLAE